MSWLRNHIWILTTIVGLVAYCFTTFASVRYVDDQVESMEHRMDRMSKFIQDGQKTTDHKLERMEDKIDLLIVRSKK